MTATTTAPRVWIGWLVLRHGKPVARAARRRLVAERKRGAWLRVDAPIPRFGRRLWFLRSMCFRTRWECLAEMRHRAACAAVAGRAPWPGRRALGDAP